jgi:amphi-Trp domain-containing protein
MGKDKIGSDLTRDEAADKLVQLAEQLRSGKVSFEGEKGEVAVADNIEFKANLDDDEIEIELKWEADED